MLELKALQQEIVDDLSSEWRALVHEYGYSIVISVAMREHYGRPKEAAKALAELKGPPIVACRKEKRGV